MKAKDVSLWAIVVAIVWVVLLFATKEIIASGAFFVVACSPVYRSIWLDKKLGLKVEGGEAEPSGESAGAGK